MYAYLQGKLTLKSPTHVYLECHGVGFLVNISLNTYSQLEKLEEAKLYTHLIVREDAHLLFGFFTEEEKNMFVQLLSVSGIGPNTARLMLSSLSISDLYGAILHDDVRLIQSVKGVGPKSAQRVIIELKDKLKKEPLHMTMPAGQTSYTTPVAEEALAALCMLGFQKASAEKALQKVLRENTGIQSVEELIKMSLKNL
jgi:holliday junction DNA helicase RuvA